MVEHPPAFTTEQADSYWEVLSTHQIHELFDHKKENLLFLLIMDDQKLLDMDDFKIK